MAHKLPHLTTLRDKYLARARRCFDALDKRALDPEYVRILKQILESLECTWAGEEHWNTAVSFSYYIVRLLVVSGRFAGVQVLLAALNDGDTSEGSDSEADDNEASSSSTQETGKINRPGVLLRMVLRLARTHSAATMAAYYIA